MKKRFRFNYLTLFRQQVVIVVVGLLVFWLDARELADPGFSTVFLVVWATFKTGYLLQQTLRRLVGFLNQGSFTYFDFLQFIGLNVLLILLSYTTDYWCLVQVEDVSFHGVAQSESLGAQFIQLMYFSTVTFGTVGFGDIVPQTGAARYLVWLEMISSFTTIILIISNFSHLRDTVPPAND